MSFQPLTDVAFRRQLACGRRKTSLPLLNSLLPEIKICADLDGTGHLILERIALLVCYRTQRDTFYVKD